MVVCEDDDGMLLLVPLEAKRAASPVGRGCLPLQGVD